MHILRGRKSTRLDCSRRKLLGCAQRFRLERQTQTVADQFCTGEGQFCGADFNACQLGNSRQFQGKQGAPEQRTAMLEHSAFAAPLSAANDLRALTNNIATRAALKTKEWLTAGF